MLAHQKGKHCAAAKNQDLWKLFLQLVRRLQGDGVNVALWRIPRNWNKRADKFARLSAEESGLLDFHVVEPDSPVSAKATRLSTTQ
jgi:hypothetical protein